MMNQLLRRIRKMHDDELIELSHEVDYEIQRRLVWPSDEAVTVSFSEHYRPAATGAPDYQRRRAA